ncbi:conserved hypothetical protein [Hyphomicrobiales bacterium]|nr:conserved hypothetical protein [Hyphomicrobiales bacterium]CAH1700862.1 conserved hypothetical protein [Hyphomicrobiales bacterium]CAI0344737.1 conserved hypothetical protein [Hyphomicrobiales bacterium]
MAVVIPFALYRRYQPRSCPFPRRMAEILFFTGVRYEQPAEAGALRGKTRRTRKVGTRKMDRRQPA